MAISSISWAGDFGVGAPFEGMDALEREEGAFLESQHSEDWRDSVLSNCPMEVKW